MIEPWAPSCGGSSFAAGRLGTLRDRVASGMALGGYAAHPHMDERELFRRRVRGFEGVLVFPFRVLGIASLHVLEEEDHAIDVPELASVRDHESGEHGDHFEHDQSVAQ